LDARLTAQRFDLVILDFGLPLISGPRCARRIAGTRAHLREIPVVTGFPGDHTELQATCVLHKPVDPVISCERFDRALSSGASPLARRRFKALSC